MESGKSAFPSFSGPKPLISHNRPKEMFGKSLENIGIADFGAL
jgi:hypothetical protein